MITLLEAFKIEVRDNIRRRRLQPSGPEAALPSQAHATAQALASSQAPSEGSLEDIEVFMNAKFLAEIEMEEQKNQEFYVWYRSKLCCGCNSRQKQLGVANFCRMNTSSISFAFAR
jgi:hypothetical protein